MLSSGDNMVTIIFLKNGPIPASFCLFLLFSHYNFNTNWKKHRWCAWETNLGPQDGRRRQNHGTLAATYGGHNLVRQADVNALILWPESLEPLTINFKLSYLTLLHLAEFFASRSNNILWENVNFSRIWTQIFGLEGKHDDHLITTNHSLELS